MTALGGAREVDSAVCWTVGAESEREGGENINELSGCIGQASGMALRVSGGSIDRSCFPPSVNS